MPYDPLTQPYVSLADRRSQAIGRAAINEAFASGGSALDAAIAGFQARGNPLPWADEIDAATLIAARQAMPQRREEPSSITRTDVRRDDDTGNATDRNVERFVTATAPPTQQQGSNFLPPPPTFTPPPQQQQGSNFSLPNPDPINARLSQQSGFGQRERQVGTIGNPFDLFPAVDPQVRTSELLATTADIPQPIELDLAGLPGLAQQFADPGIEQLRIRAGLQRDDLTETLAGLGLLDSLEPTQREFSLIDSGLLQAESGLLGDAFPQALSALTSQAGLDERLQNRRLSERELTSGRELEAMDLSRQLRDDLFNVRDRSASTDLAQLGIEAEIGLRGRTEDRAQRLMNEQFGTIAPLSQDQINQFEQSLDLQQLQNFDTGLRGLRDINSNLDRLDAIETELGAEGVTAERQAELISERTSLQSTIGTQGRNFGVDTEGLSPAQLRGMINEFGADIGRQLTEAAGGSANVIALMKGLGLGPLTSILNLDTRELQAETGFFGPQFGAGTSQFRPVDTGTEQSAGGGGNWLGGIGTFLGGLGGIYD